MEQQLQIREQELEKAQNETYRIKLDFEERFKKMNDELDGFRSREHDLLSVNSIMSILIASNDMAI